PRLRLFSLIPLALSVVTARRLLHLPRAIHTTSATLTLATELLIANPFLLALSPAILLVTLLLSIPFLTLIFRLLLIGYASPPFKGSPALEWHLYGWAGWAVAASAGVWLWTWGVARGILRMTCASVIGAWYFADPDAPVPPPTSTHTIHAALTRSTGPSLGTVVLSALILTLIRILTLLTLVLQRLPMYIPARAFFIVSGTRMAVGYLEGVTTALSGYALVYAGITGDPFMPSARRSRVLTASVEAKARTGRGRRGASVESPLTLLTVAPLTLTFPFALTTYLFVAHTLGAPGQALGAAVLAGGVTALVGMFCVGLVRDIADTLFLCYCVDVDAGMRRREEVFVVYEYDQRLPPAPSPPPPQQHPQRHQPSNQPLQHKPQRKVPQKHQPPRQQSQPRYMPSESTSRYLPRQPLSPPSPPPSMQPRTDREDDVNPFEPEQSYLQDNTIFQPALAPTTMTTTVVPATKGAGTDGGVGVETMKTSAELNMKSRVETKGGAGSDSEEEGGEGSQFFPGSGFF
ncbi:hypothetical protein Hypma_009712, partial [Hypsizygus marmoreus]